MVGAGYAGIDPLKPEGTYNELKDDRGDRAITVERGVCAAHPSSPSPRRRRLPGGSQKLPWGAW